MGKRSRVKGAAYERWVANYFEGAGFPEAQRGLGQARDGSEIPDVQVDDLWVQTKHGARPNPIAALEQAIRDMGERDLFPVAICRQDRGRDTVTMLLPDFVALFTEWKERQP